MLNKKAKPKPKARPKAKRTTAPPSPPMPDLHVGLPAVAAIRLMTHEKGYGGFIPTPVGAYKTKPAAIEPSEELIALVSTLVRAGAHPRVAMRALGITDRVTETWIAYAADVPDGPHARFLLALQMADAQGEVIDIAKVNANRDWRATAWLRERRNANRWGGSERKDDSDISIPQPVAVEEMTEGELEQAALVMKYADEFGIFKYVNGSATPEIKPNGKIKHD